MRGLLRREVRGVGVDDDSARLNDDRIRLDAGAGIDEAAAGGDLELPEMPRAADDFALADEIEVRAVPYT